MSETLKTRPCKCPVLRPAECSICRAAVTNPKFAHWQADLPADTAPPTVRRQFAAVTECANRGLPTGETHPCSTCTGKVDVPLLACGVHGQCTITKAVTLDDGKPVKCCRLCTDRVIEWKPKNGPMFIPKVFHRIWIGDNPIPEVFDKYWQTWKNLHPDWQFKTWMDEDIAELNLFTKDAYAQARNPAEKSDILRFELIYRFGGVYLDTDFEAWKNIEPTLCGSEFVSCHEPSGVVASGFFAAIAEHPLLSQIIKELQTAKIDLTANQVVTAGPVFFTKHINAYPDRSKLELLPVYLFYPFDYGATGRPEEYPKAYAAHWWSHTWKDWWVTITFVIHGEQASERAKALEGKIGKGDIITTDTDSKPQTMFEVHLWPGDKFTENGISTIRDRLRHAPNYGQCDFAFRDSTGGWLRVGAVKDRGNAITRYDDVVLNR